MREVLTRELRSHARRGATYWTRLAAATAAVGYFYYVDRTHSLHNGRDQFYAISVIATLLCVFEGIRRGAASIATEKQEGTFPLLLLTKLTGREIIFGKFLSLLHHSLQLLLAVAPVMAIPILIGGVAGADLLRVLAALWHFLFLSLVISVCSSAMLPTALGATTLAVFTITFGLLCSAVFAAFTYKIPAALAFNPCAPALWLLDQNFPDNTHVAIALLLTEFLAFALLWRSGSHLAEDHAYEQSYLAHHTATQSPPQTPRWFNAPPMQWLIRRDLNIHQTMPGILGLAAIAAVGCSFASNLADPFAFILAWFLLFFFAVGAPISLARARREGALELLLTTPIAKNLRFAYTRALLQILTWPAAILLGALLISVLRAAATHHFKHFLVLLLGFLVTPIVAIASALATNTPTRAILASLFVIIILPTIIPFTQPYYFPAAGLVAFLFQWRAFRNR